jgi:hypothetical protein
MKTARSNTVEYYVGGRIRVRFESSGHESDHEFESMVLAELEEKLIQLSTTGKIFEYLHAEEIDHTWEEIPYEE